VIVSEHLEGRTLFATALSTASFASMAVDANEQVHIAYIDATDSGLKYLTYSENGNWGVPQVVDAGDFAESRPSLAMLQDGSPAIAYYDPVNKDLKFAQLASGSWSTDVVDSKGDVGLNPAMIIDGNGRPTISYYASDKQDLRLATLNRSKWKAKTLDARGDVGRYSSLAINPLNGSVNVVYDVTDKRQLRMRIGQKKMTVGTLADSTNWAAKPSMSFTAEGIPTVAYANVASGQLIFSQYVKSGKKKTWESSVAATGLSANSTTQVFLGSEDSHPTIAFTSADGNVLVARLEENAWTTNSMGVSPYLAAAIAHGSKKIAVVVDSTPLYFTPASSAPASLEAKSQLSGVVLTWADRSNNEAGFVVERSLDGTSWSAIGEVPANVTTYTDSTTAPGNSYQYRVRTSGTSGNTRTSNVAPFGMVVGVPTVFSQKWKDNWNTALAADHPWAKLLMDNANASGTTGQRYSDYGDYGTYAYLLTGDVAYADKAWTIIQTHLHPSTDLNFLRGIPKFALLYHGLKQGGYWDLHANRRQQFVDMLNTWSDATLDHAGFRYSDSDQIVAALGITAWSLISQGENSQAERFLTDPRLGGLNVTSTERTNVRNSIADYCRRAAGGQWIEGTGYNMETLAELIQATEGVRAVMGKDYFPEVTAYYQEAAISEMALITPDMHASLQWGDNQWPRHLQNWYRVATLGMLAGVTQDTPTGEYIQDFLRDYANTHGWRGDLATAEPWGHVFFAFNPLAPEADWRAHPAFAVPAGGVAVSDNPGQGLTFIREGTGNNATLAGLQNYIPTGVDHALPNAWDFQLYHSGEWVFTRPVGYANGGLSANTMLAAGYGVVSEATGRTGYEVGASGSFVYTAGSTGGSTVWNGYYGPPETFIHEMTRSMFYLPAGTAGGVPTLISFDRANVDQPNLEGYHYAIDRDQITNSPLKQWAFHAPVMPTVTASAGGTALTWQTKGGQDVRIDVLADNMGVEVAQTTTSVIGGFLHAPEDQRYVSRLTPTTYQKWDTVASVMQAGELTPGVSNTKVSSAGGEAKGVLVHRPGVNDVVVLFNARQAADLPPVQTDWNYLRYNPAVMGLLKAGRLHQTGFAVNVTTTTSAATIHLADLDPSKNWTIRIDGAASAPLAVSAEGLGHVTLTSAGSHHIEITVAP